MPATQFFPNIFVIHILRHTSLPRFLRTFDTSADRGRRTGGGGGWPSILSLFTGPTQYCKQTATLLFFSLKSIVHSNAEEDAHQSIYNCNALLGYEKCKISLTKSVPWSHPWPSGVCTRLRIVDVFIYMKACWHYKSIKNSRHALSVSLNATQKTMHCAVRTYLASIGERPNLIH